MTNSPERKIEYKMPNELEHLFVKHGFKMKLSDCRVRTICDETFEHGKAGHTTTVHELGEVFTDSSGIRAVIFHYKLSSGETIRSIKRLVAAEADYRLPQPTASG